MGLFEIQECKTAMERIDGKFSDQVQMRRDIYLLISLLPPPISLDILCSITRHPPVKTLQIVENMVQSGDVLRYMEKGAGYYRLADVKVARERLMEISPPDIVKAAKQALSGVYDYLPDTARRWLNIAYIYQISGLSVGHFKDLIRAGHYCLNLNLPMDAAVYYRMALEGMAGVSLEPEEDRKSVV